MPLTTLHPLSDVLVTAFNPTAGSAGGSHMVAPSPVRGLLIEAGFMPASLIASTMTLAVAIGAQTSTIASAFTQCITSTLGTFTSTLLIEGGICSANPPSPAYVNPGDAIQWITSGGNTSAAGATMYAIIRRA